MSGCFSERVAWWLPRYIERHNTLPAVDAISPQRSPLPIHSGRVPVPNTGDSVRGSLRFHMERSRPEQTPPRLCSQLRALRDTHKTVPGHFGRPCFENRLHPGSLIDAGQPVSQASGVATLGEKNSEFFARGSQP
jgi:hypothetical protein